MMRKISDLFSRAEPAGEIGREDLEGGGAALIDFRIKDGDVDQQALINHFYESIDFPASMRDGNLAHISGATEGEIIFTIVWDSQANADESYADLTPAIESAIAEFTDSATVERQSSRVYRFSIGEDVGEFSHLRAANNPDCVGYMIDIPVHGHLAYDLTCKKMNFPEEFPRGLLMHVAAQSELGWRTFSMWRTVEDSREFLEQRLMPAAVDVVRDTGIFPEIRPLEVKPFMFVLNARMLG